MGTPYTVEDESAIDVIATGDLIRVYDLSSKSYKYASIDQMRTGAATVVATTAGATTLTITATSHSGKTIVLNNTAPIAVTLPQATGTGNKFRFFVAVAATATASTIKVANATDVMAGFQFTVTTTATNVEGFATSATSDTISINGTTLGGIAGDVITIEDVKTGVFSVIMLSSSTGTEATPFSATVS